MLELGLAFLLYDIAIALFSKEGFVLKVHWERVKALLKTDKWENKLLELDSVDCAISCLEKDLMLEDRNAAVRDAAKISNIDLPPFSPFFFSFSEFNGKQEAIKLAVKVLKKKIEGIEFDCIVTISTGVEPLIPELEKVFGVSVFKFKETKTWTPGESPRGLHAGQRVLLLGDLITSADSKLKSIEVLEKKNLKVAALLVFLNREQGGVQGLVDRGIKVVCVYNISTLLDIYVHADYIDPEMRDMVLRYINSNQFQPTSKIASE